MGISRIKTVMIAVALWLLATPSWALDAPSSTRADQDGNFSYYAESWGFPHDPVSDWVMRDLGNTDVGELYADCFCPPDYSGCVGEVPIPVTGSLQDPSMDGSVSIEVFRCSGTRLEATTTIRAAPPRNLPTISGLGTILLPLLLLASGTSVFGRG